MDSLMAWKAAPCIKAYVRDLKLYMQQNMERQLPLVYTAQDNGIGAAVTAPEAMRLTANYLSCQSDKGDPTIDVFGINVESWCSSTGTFEKNDDGSEGTYYSLWKALDNTTVALIFAEMGCAHSLFNRDNHIADKNRDWKQVPVVLNDMADTWSGFSAYTYDGNPDFDMFRGGPWNGRDVLEPTQDFFNFCHQLEATGQAALNSTQMKHEESPPLCTDVRAEIQSCCDGVFSDHHVELYDVDKIPSYRHREFFAAVKKSPDDDGFTVAHSHLSGDGFGNFTRLLVVVLCSVAALLIFRGRRRMRDQLVSASDDTEVTTLNVQYKSIN